MTPEQLQALTGLAFAAAWTPGPNNSMLASSGATYGLRRSLPHIAGISVGFPLMIFLIGIGLGEIFQAVPALAQILRYVGAAMLLWIAWRTATAAPPGEGRRGTRPLSLIEAAAFQWVNPKSWMAAIAITAQFVTEEARVSTSAIVAMVFMAAALSSTVAWAGFGQGLGRWLGTGRRLRLFNGAMALLLILFLAMLF